ncbi:hypothetical protein KI387_008446, partial [Taxus chinensis]
HPPYLVHRHFSLQSQIQDLQLKLQAKIQLENAEDLRQAQHAQQTPHEDPYHFSLPPSRERGHDHSFSSRGCDHSYLGRTSYDRGTPGKSSRHFPFLFLEEIEKVPQTPMSNPVPTPGTPECKFWRQHRLSLLERAIEKATKEFQALLQEEEYTPSIDTYEEVVERLIMDKAYEQYEAEHNAE